MAVLFITSTRIGDAVLSTGVLDHILLQYPGARVTIACGPAAAPLFAAVPGLDRVITLRKQRFAGHWLGLWAATVGTKWDVVVDLRGSAISWLLRAGKRLMLKPSAGLRHRVPHNADLFGLGDAPPPPKVWTLPSHLAAAALHIPAGPPVLAVGPTANWGGKQWPAERFAALVEGLTAADGILPRARVAVFGAASERAMAEPLLAAIPAERRIDLVGQLDLLTAHACLERCALYVGNDSGLMHLAAASGTPTLGLFGPSREQVYAPWGRHTAFLRTDLSYDEILAKPGYDYRKSDSHMDSLPVAKVQAAAEALWSRVQAERAA